LYTPCAGRPRGRGAGRGKPAEKAETAACPVLLSADELAVCKVADLLQSVSMYGGGVVDKLLGTVPAEHAGSAR